METLFERDEDGGRGREKRMISTVNAGNSFEVWHNLISLKIFLFTRRGFFRVESSIPPSTESPNISLASSPSTHVQEDRLFPA